MRVLAFIICFSLLVVLATGQTWDVQQVDSTAASGSPVELVKAADGKLWVGYGTKSGAARVACLGDSGWTFNDVCASAQLPGTNYRPFLAASPKGELCLACYDSSAGNNRLFRMVGDTWLSEPNPFNDSAPTNTVAYDTAGRLYTLLQSFPARFVLAHETDSGWTANFVVDLLSYLSRWASRGRVGYLTASSDGSPWFFGFSAWSGGTGKWACATDLLHFSGDAWVSVWGVLSYSDYTPYPLALAPHGVDVGNLTSYNNSILYDSETVIGQGDFNTVAGMSYDAGGVPLAAWVSSYSASRPKFAFQTDRWRTETIPGPAGYRGVDVKTDSAGQVVIVYSTKDSGLWCARGTNVIGVHESPRPQLSCRKREPTILSGASAVKLGSSSVVFDVMGRRVANPRSGVCFVREEPQATSPKPQARTIRKIVIAE